MNGKARGTPAKFAATPAKVVSAVLMNRGVPSRMAAYGMRSPSTAPPAAVTRLTLIVSQYSWRYGWCSAARTWSSVAPPCALLNAPTMTSPAGTNRKARAYAKNGSVPSHASGRRLRPDTMSGRRAPGASVCVASDRPTSDRRPFGRDLRLRSRLLRGGRELDLRVELRRRQGFQHGGRDPLP